MKELLDIDGIGETQIESLEKFFSNKINLQVLSELKKIIKISDVETVNKTGMLKNKTFMFTGKLKEKSLVEKNSGKIISNVSKKLDYLVVGEKSTTKKINNAKELNVNVINQEEWEKMLNKAS